MKKDKNQTPGKRYKIKIISKKDGSVLDTIICDYSADVTLAEDMILVNYYRTHKINPLNVIIEREYLNVSKGLEALEDIKETLGVIWVDSRFDIIEKELKALDIIKKKCSPLLKQYLLDLLPKEEYDLLKEVLL